MISAGVSLSTSQYPGRKSVTEQTFFHHLHGSSSPEPQSMANWGAVHMAGGGVSRGGRRRPRTNKATEKNAVNQDTLSLDNKNTLVSIPDGLSSSPAQVRDVKPNTQLIKYCLTSHSLISGGQPTVQGIVPQKVPKKFHNCKSSGCEIVTINVSGMIFELSIGLLNRHPSTLLGNPLKRKKHYDKNRNEYFFDRHRLTFEAIFNYYKYGGKLRRPPGISDEIFLDEVEFYEIETNIVNDYKEEEGYTEEKIILPENALHRKVWMLFEYPESSTVAFIIAVVSVIITVLSIVTFCLETLEEFGQPHCTPDNKPSFKDDPFFMMESICTAWFTFELFVRFWCCPSKCSFFKDWKNWIDVAAIAPYYIGLANSLASQNCKHEKGGSSLAFLRVIRLVRIFKLTKHSSGLQVLVLTFKASFEGLGLFLVALIVCVLLFSSAVYFAEIGEEKSNMESIPDAFWWSVITMCTVGYGDKHPVGLWGKLVGSLCALAGVLTLAIPVPIITENFNKFYSHRSQGKRVV